MHAGSRPPARCCAARAGLPRAGLARPSIARAGLARPSLPGCLSVSWPCGQLCPGPERTVLARPIIAGLASDGRWPSVTSHHLAWLDVVSTVATSAASCGSSPSHTQSGWYLLPKGAH